MKMNTIDDAEIFLKETGIKRLKWTGQASAEGFAEWVSQNCNEINTVVFDHELTGYLTSIGEDPARYGINMVE